MHPPSIDNLGFLFCTVAFARWFGLFDFCLCRFGPWPFEWYHFDMIFARVPRKWYGLWFCRIFRMNRRPGSRFWPRWYWLWMAWQAIIGDAWPYFPWLRLRFWLKIGSAWGVIVKWRNHKDCFPRFSLRRNFLVAEYLFFKAGDNNTGHSCALNRSRGLAC